MNFFDVNHLNELPDPPNGMRYFDFIGGDKNLRCFLVPETTARPVFIENNEHLLDPTMHAIYSNNGICVRQDSSHPLPGFYIISPTSFYKSIDLLEEDKMMRIFFILREIRKSMREVLGIEFIHLYYEERQLISSNVHFWLLPIYNIKDHPRIYNFDIKKYLDSFTFDSARSKILEFNEKMRLHLNSVNLLERDNEYISIFKKMNN